MESRFICPEAAPSAFEREVLIVLAGEVVELADALLREGEQVRSCTSAEAADLLATSKLERRHGVLLFSPARPDMFANRPVLLASHAAVRAGKYLRFSWREV